MTDDNCCRASARDSAVASQMGFTDFPVPLLPKPEHHRRSLRGPLNAASQVVRVIECEPVG